MGKGIISSVLLLNIVQICKSEKTSAKGNILQYTFSLESAQFSLLVADQNENIKLHQRKKKRRNKNICSFQNRFGIPSEPPSWQYWCKVISLMMLIEVEGSHLKPNASLIFFRCLSVQGVEAFSALLQFLLL